MMTLMIQKKNIAITVHLKNGQKYRCLQSLNLIWLVAS